MASNHLEAMAKTRLAFNETLWTLPPPLHQGSNLSNPINNNVDQDDMLLKMMMKLMMKALRMIWMRMKKK